MKLLATGDVHLGRRPSRLPNHLDAQRCSAAAVWDDCITCAIEQRVAAFVITGDVVDRENRYFEAFGPLERGVRRLADAGIEILAIAGNHDHDVFPRLMQTVGSARFHLLGAEQRWQRHTLANDDGARVHIDGWSFARQHVRENPLESYRPAPADGVPVVALLHTDVDQANSRYAPTTLAALQAQPVDVWLLGHRHRPFQAAHEGGPTVINVGSPQGFDPGEPGVHGPWLIELQRGEPAQVEQVPLARVRYERLDVDLAGVNDEDAFEAQTASAVQQALSGIAGERGALEHVLFRLRLGGRTKLHRRLVVAARRLQDDLTLQAGDVTASIERIVFETQPDLDLAALARNNDPVGALARVLRALDVDELPAEYDRLLQVAGERVGAVRQGRAFLALEASDATGIERDEVQALVRRQALLLLDALVAQKEGAA